MSGQAGQCLPSLLRLLFLEEAFEGLPIHPAECSEVQSPPRLGIVERDAAVCPARQHEWLFGAYAVDLAVARHAASMKQLAAHPDSPELRAELGVGDDIIDPVIRELELRNWLRFVDSVSG